MHSDLIDVDIFRTTLAREDRLDVLLELGEGLFILTEGIVHVAGYSVAITCITSRVVAVLSVLEFVDVVERFA